MLNFTQTMLLSGLFGGGSGSGGEQKSPMSMILMMGGLFVVMYFVSIRPQRKKQKAEQTMRESIQIGDEITTIGGIMGRVVTVKEDSIIIETGADRNKMKMTRWAIQTNNTATERAEAEKEAAKAAQNAEKEAQERSLQEGGQPEKVKKIRRTKDDRE